MNLETDLDILINNTIKTKKVAVLSALIEKNNDIFISGKSSSGKTILIANTIKEKMNDGYYCNWIDLQDVDMNINSIFINIAINIKESKKNIIVVDNIHNSPETIQDIINNVNAIRNNSNNIKLIIIGWPSVEDIVNKYLPTAIHININSLDTINEIIEAELSKDLVEKFRDGILHLSNKDVLVSKQIIEYVKHEKVLPTKKQIGEIMFEIIVNKNNLSNNAILILYYISILGQFEIQVSSKFLYSISKDGLGELINLKIVKTTSDKKYYFLGHRSLNNQLVLYLESTYMKDNKLYAIDVVTDYIMQANTNQIINILDRLDLQNRKIINNKKILKTLWNTFIYLQEKLYTQINRDITWNNNLYSAIQSANIMANMKFDEQADKQFEKEKNFISELCGINNNEFCRYKESTEYIDFMQIINAMQEDDKYFSKEYNHKNIDIDKFYKTYTIGMMLGFECNIKDNQETISKYIKILENLQEKDGSFYPKRVPWVTARIIISLTRAGLSYNNSTVVQKACDWLMSNKNENLCNGEWKSGTGYWNTNMNVTLLCLEALNNAGVNIDNANVQQSIAYIKSKKKEIFTNNKELDAVMYIYNMVKYNYQLTDIIDELEIICKWCTGNDILNDVNLLSNESNDESQKAASIINYLIQIIYEILRKETPSLLIALQYEKKDEIGDNYIGIHGSFGSPYCNWFQWLYSVVTQRGQEIIIPQLPTGPRQNYKNWSRILQEYLDIGMINENTIIVAHSIAPIFVCKFLIEYQVKVKRLIFVCGFNNVFNIAPDYDMVNSDMYTENLEQIHEYCDDIVCLYSDNDPYVPYEDEKNFVDIVADRSELIKGGGHLNAEKGYIKFNELLKYL